MLYDQPQVNILVKIYHGEEERQERISVRQTVKQFKLYLQVRKPAGLASQFSPYICTNV
jgi:hypothetical protein